MISERQPAASPVRAAPLQVVFWEVTKSCDLACSHCRAVAKRYRDPQELTTEEGFRVLDQLQAMQVPVVVFSGGDPLKRDDLFELIGYARQLGLKVGVTPSATPLLSHEVIDRFRDAGVANVVMSLDSSVEETHDRFRRSPGAFLKTITSIRYIRSQGLAAWINTALLPHNITELEELGCLLAALDVQAWNLLAVIPTGRGSKLEGLTAQQYAGLFLHIYDLSQALPFPIHVSYAPQYRRVVHQHLEREGLLDSPRGRALMAPAPIAGDGSLFIDHRGNVWPSGVLPLSGGNVRQQPLAEIYASSPLFVELRDVGRLPEKCRACEFRQLCSGGSRARAYAVTGDHMAMDPLCLYELPLLPEQQAVAGAAAEV